MGQCNFCRLKNYKLEAKKKGNRIILKPSSFMAGILVFEVPKGKKLDEGRIEPCDNYPNGNENYSRYFKSWMGKIGNRCEC